MFKATQNSPEHDCVSPYASLDTKELHAAAHRRWTTTSNPAPATLATSKSAR